MLSILKYSLTETLEWKSFSVSRDLGQCFSNFTVHVSHWDS